MAGAIIEIILMLLLFVYLFTYPYEFTFKRKLKRILHINKVNLVLKPKKRYKDFSVERLKKEFEIEERYFDSSYVDEKMKVLIVKPTHMTGTPKCLLLLHGIRDKAEYWLSKAKLRENYLTLKESSNIEDIVFILPNSGYNSESWYSNFYKSDSHRYEEFFSKELLSYIETEYPNSEKGIAGFSMGGYGALKLGLKNLSSFETIASFSGAVSLIRLGLNRRIIRFFNWIYIPKFLFGDTSKNHFFKVFGPWGYKILKNDPYTLMKKNKNYDNRFYFSVGSADKKPYLMFQQWLDIVGRAKKLKLNFKAYLYKNEKHNWDYISKDIYNFLLFFSKK